VVEDSEWTFEMLEKEGFSDEVISVLRCVTMKSEEDYETFVNRIAQNPIAVEVKINDLLDNLDITRFKNLNERDLKRLNKYLKAFWELQKIKTNTKSY
jgi:hypothetical protein